jgi:AmmeMemoRadiSam system protein B
VAGLFYPRGRGQLATTVDELVAAARRAGPAGATARAAFDVDLRALVVPHAGYRYSGPVAARGYALVAACRRETSRVILLGPSHRVPWRGMACSAADRWSTPLGDVDVEGVPGLPADDRPHAYEHALEVQLPFLQRVLPGHFTIVPIAVGLAEPAEVADLLQLLDTVLPGLVVVSTDLSHYHDAVTADQLDRRTAAAVLARDVEAIGVDDACGVWALRGLLEHARRRDHAVRQLDLRNSADTAGDPARAVGYGCFAVTASRAGDALRAP